MPIYLTQKRAVDLKIPSANLEKAKIKPGYLTWVRRKTTRKLMEGGGRLEEEMELVKRIVAKVEEVAKNNDLEFTPVAVKKIRNNGSYAIFITKQKSNVSFGNMAVAIVDITKKNEELKFVTGKEESSFKFAKDYINWFEKELTSYLKAHLQKS